jgi:PAS domain-containing protein
MTGTRRLTGAKIKTGALQDAIFNSANFSSIATDEKGVIQIFNVGAERMLGYTAIDVVNQITPADISDPQELIARAAELSFELDTPITPGFEALVFKASRGIVCCRCRWPRPPAHSRTYRNTRPQRWRIGIGCRHS